MTEEQAREMILLMERAGADRDQMLQAVQGINEGLARLADIIGRIEETVNEIAADAGTDGPVAPSTPGGD